MRYLVCIIHTDCIFFFSRKIVPKNNREEKKIQKFYGEKVALSVSENKKNRQTAIGCELMLCNKLISIICKLCSLYFTLCALHLFYFFV